jgi:hypothetical protein
MKRSSFLVLSTVLLLVTTAYAKDIHLNFDMGTDFSKYKTYAFIRASDTGQTGLLTDLLARKRLEEMIGAQLQSKGLQEVSADRKPNLTIRYRTVTSEKEKQKVAELLGGDSYLNTSWAAACGDLDPKDLKEEEDLLTNTLIVDVMDVSKKEPIWSAYLRDTLKNENPELKQTHKRLETAFKHYPPSEKDKEKLQKRETKIED